ncbi:DUF1206 domain-containing protein [Nocardioides bruguierae]|uniref:DUF1206 domain-containing protein n=1 Tax=Nocardioides bruguierae TaxID=2945102 RepID=A0A9X2ICW4_9ACTN|nr:DUF1206 domain-containing protein [Nocardioides bruguierae]MCM0619131.1 DUF1206 domain-containing protein [Nocardioides bruguierae]
MSTADTVREHAREAGDSPVVEWGARLGYAANGVLHLLLAWLTWEIAEGTSGDQASQSGALAELARQPGGQLALWVLVAGFALLAVWQLTEAIVRRRAGDKAKAAAKLVGYTAIGWTAAVFAAGGRSSSNRTTSDFTRMVIGWPAGQWLVGAVGAVVLAIGGYHVVKGARRAFLRDLREHPGVAAVVAGAAGYVGKGLALVAVGVLFIVAAAEHEPGRATGLDGALRSLQQLPAGQVVLGLVALGLACFGGYSFFRAWFARV